MRRLRRRGTNLTRIKWIWPDVFVGFRKQSDVREYGLRLDLRTEITYYTYEWGRGVTFVVLGFGFEVCRCGL